MAGCGCELCLVLDRAPGRADDMDDARLGSEARKFDGGGRRSEVEHAFGVEEGRERIVADDHTRRAKTGDLASILADKGRTLALDCRMQRHAVDGVDEFDQRL